jgi:hypothetical protein
MVENTYKRAGGEIKTGAVQYNVQPNLTVSRGFQNLEAAVQKGMQLKQQMNESDFQKRQTDLRNTMSVFKENYEKASWKERQMMAEELKSMETGSTGKDNKWDRELERMGIEFSSAVNVNLEREREQRRKAAAAEAKRRAAAARAASNRRKALQGKIEQLELFETIADAEDVDAQRAALDTWREENITPYVGSEDIDDMAAYADGLTIYNKLNPKISTAEENAYQQQRTIEQKVAVVELQRNMSETTDVGLQQQLTNDFFSNYVQPLEGSTDADDLNLYGTALHDYNRANEAVTLKRREIADTALVQDAVLANQAILSANGGITPEEYTQNRDTYIAQRSDYETNKAALNQGYADLTINSVMSQYNRPDFVPTDMDVKVLNTQIADLAKADPYIKSSPKFREAQNFATQMGNTVNRLKEIDVSAALSNPEVSFNAFKVMSEDLVADGIISDEVHQNNLSTKKVAVKDSTQRQLMLPYIENGDAEGLAGLVSKNPDIRVGTVQSTVAEVLQFQHDNVSKANPDSQGRVNANTLKEWAKYEENGIAPTSLPAIDQALQAPRSGEQMDDQQVLDFLQTYEAKEESGYFIKNVTSRRNAAADYLTLKGMIDFGVPDPGATLYNARQNRVSVKQADVDDSIMDAIGANPTWGENLNPQNSRFLLSALRPVAKVMMEGGYDPSTVGEFVERSLDTDWLRVDPRIGGSSDVWIPKSENIPTAKSYMRVYDTINGLLKDNGQSRLEYLAPLSPRDADGDWIAIDKDGRPATFTAEEIGTVSRTGRLPN